MIVTPVKVQIQQNQMEATSPRSQEVEITQTIVKTKDHNVTHQ